MIIFRRLYTSIITLILRSEFLTSSDVAIWKFILDCFALHFLFIRDRRAIGFCEEIWDLNEKVNSENLLLRFITTINIFPYELILNSEIKHSLFYNFAMLGKHYENLSLYPIGRTTFIHKAIIRKLFMSSLELLQNRFKNEEEQDSILRVINYYMKILSNYINYHAEYGSVKVVINVVTPFKQSFREIMYQLQTMQTIRKNQKLNDQILESILHATKGLERMKEVSIVRKKISMLIDQRFQLSRKKLLIATAEG